MSMRHLAMTMQMEEALSTLSVSLPRIEARSLSEAEAQVARWKSDVLRPAFKDAARATHPDHGGDPEHFRKARHAYEYLDREVCALPIGAHTRTLSVMDMRQGISMMLGILSLLAQLGGGGDGDPPPVEPAPQPVPSPAPEGA